MSLEWMGTEAFPPQQRDLRTRGLEYTVALRVCQRSLYVYRDLIRIGFGEVQLLWLRVCIRKVIGPNFHSIDPFIGSNRTWDLLVIDLHPFDLTAMSESHFCRGRRFSNGTHVFLQCLGHHEVMSNKLSEETMFTSNGCFRSDRINYWYSSGVYTLSTRQTFRFTRAKSLSKGVCVPSHWMIDFMEALLNSQCQQKPDNRVVSLLPSALINEEVQFLSRSLACCLCMIRALNTHHRLSPLRAILSWYINIFDRLVPTSWMQKTTGEGRICLVRGCLVGKVLHKVESQGLEFAIFLAGIKTVIFLRQVSSCKNCLWQRAHEQ